MFFRIIGMAYQNIIAHKLRSFLTMLGIIIGIASTIMIISIGAGAQSLIINEINALGTDKIGVIPGAVDENGPPAAILGITITTLTIDDFDDLRNSISDHIIAGSPFIIGNGTAQWNGVKKDVTFYGASEEYLEIESGDIGTGVFFDKDDANSLSKIAVLGATISKDIFGDTNPIGKKFKIDNTLLTVIGVIESKESSAFSTLDDLIIVPMKTAQKTMLGIDYIHALRLQVDDVQRVEEVKLLIQERLRDRHTSIIKKDGSDDDFTVRTAQQALDLFKSITDSITFFLAGIAAISLLVGGIGIMNIMLIVVNDKIREIGIRKAVGARPYHILSQFLVETLVLTLIGALIGVIIGFIISFIVAKLAQFLGYNWTFIFPIYSLLMTVGIAVSLGIIFGIYPALKASKLNPIEALRYE